jgi:hypothetical protein
LPTHAPGLQARQAAPPLPQALTELPGRHTPAAEQQPFGQVAALHGPPPSTGGAPEHAWLTHTWPIIVLHCWHVWPPLPQRLLLPPPMQALNWPKPAQQPFGQLADEHGTPASGTPRHVWPRQTPGWAQVWHCTPPFPQLAFEVPVRQTADEPKPEQQPLAHVAALHLLGTHAWASQAWPAATMHEAHCRPPLPHEATDVPAWQTAEAPVPTQQPLQFAGPQADGPPSVPPSVPPSGFAHPPSGQGGGVPRSTQAWAWHTWVAAHAEQAAPPAPQEGALSPSWHSPVESQQPEHEAGLQSNVGFKQAEPSANSDPAASAAAKR